MSDRSRRVPAIRTRAPYLTPVQEQSIFIVHRHAQSRVGDDRSFWNFERPPELNGLAVKGFLSPNPISKAVRGTFVRFSRAKGARCWRFASFGRPRANEDEAENQSAEGA